MFPKYNLFSRTFNISSILQGTSKCQVHYQIGKDGQKLIISNRNNVRTKREKWQKISHMGYEKEVREIKRIELDERLHSDSKMAKITAQSKMKQLSDRLQNSGFCRDHKTYNPPKDIEERINTIFMQILNTTEGNFVFSLELKFKLLTACSAEFDHEPNNSLIYGLKTIENVKEFYLTPVRGVNSYDHMVVQPSNLPKNLYVIPEAIRFNPETDTFFDGVDAFPASSSELVGLRAKKRYEAKPKPFEWPDI